MALLPAEVQQQRARLDARIAQVKAEVRITDLLAKLGVFSAQGSRGKLVCVFPAHLEKTGSMKVYEDTDSVHCFGCGMSGDVLWVARQCVSRRGQVLSVEHAVEWLETTFGLVPPPMIRTLTDRLGSRLGRWREGNEAERAAPSAIGQPVAEEQVLAMLRTLHREHPHVRGALGGFEDFLWAGLDAPEVDYGTWATEAQRLIRVYAYPVAAALTEALATDFHPREASGSDVPLQEALE